MIILAIILLAGVALFVLLKPPADIQNDRNFGHAPISEFEKSSKGTPDYAAIQSTRKDL